MTDGIVRDTLSATLSDARFSSQELNPFVGIAVDLAMAGRLEFKWLERRRTKGTFIDAGRRIVANHHSSNRRSEVVAATANQVRFFVLGSYSLPTLVSWVPYALPNLSPSDGHRL